MLGLLEQQLWLMMLLTLEQPKRSQKPEPKGPMPLRPQMLESTPDHLPSRDSRAFSVSRFAQSSSVSRFSRRSFLHWDAGRARPSILHRPPGGARLKA